MKFGTDSGAQRSRRRHWIRRSPHLARASGIARIVSIRGAPERQASYGCIPSPRLILAKTHQPPPPPATLVAGPAAAAPGPGGLAAYDSSIASIIRRSSSSCTSRYRSNRTVLT